jgi:hypothetical protein
MTGKSSFEGVTIAAWSIGIVGTFLLMALLVFAMYHYTRPEPLGANRQQERQQFLTETRQASADALHSFAWIDQSKGFVRVPIERALELTLREWQDPVAARANLISRMEKATEAPPPPPEPENPYE